MEPQLSILQSAIAVIKLSKIMSDITIVVWNKQYTLKKIVVKNIKHLSIVVWRNISSKKNNKHAPIYLLICD